MNPLNAKIKTSQNGVTSTLPALTNSTVEVSKMATNKPTNSLSSYQQDDSLRSIGDLLSTFISDLESGSQCDCVLERGERGDSVLEQAFWRELHRTPGGWHRAIDQFRVGFFRADCLIECDGKYVVIELDGKAFHKASADAMRDAQILPHVDAIIRIPFRAMWFYPQATLDAIGSWFPRLKPRAEDIRSVPIEDLHRERDFHEDPYRDGPTFEEWLEDASWYQVWAVEGNTAWIGSPNQMLRGPGGSTIVLQRGAGASEAVKRQLEERTKCLPYFYKKEQHAA